MTIANYIKLVKALHWGIFFLPRRKRKIKTKIWQENFSLSSYDF
jgi:hypothetical protein